MVWEQYTIPKRTKASHVPIAEEPAKPKIPSAIRVIQGIARRLVMKKTVSAITAMAIAGLLMCGCASGNASEGSKPTASEQFSENVANEDRSEPETIQDLLDRIVTAGSKAGATIEEFIRDREDASPQIVRIGEWANATENLDALCKEGHR